MFSRAALLFCLLGCVCAQLANVTIYNGQTGSLERGFQSWSGSSVNLKDTTFVKPGGKYSLSFIPASTNLVLHGNFVAEVNRLTNLTFWISSGSNSGQDLDMALNGGEVGKVLTLSKVIGGKTTGNTWMLVSFPFSTFQVSDPNTALYSLEFRRTGTSGASKIYFSGIGFSVNLPAAGPVTVSIDASAPIPLSPYIFGVNLATEAQLQSGGYTVNRWGGEVNSRYAWDIDAANMCHDRFFENTPHRTAMQAWPTNTTADEFVDNSTRMNSEVMLLTPTIGWRPFDRKIRCGFSVKKYGPQQKVDPAHPDCGIGIKPDGSYVTGNDPHDTSIETPPTYNVEWINHLDKLHGKGAVRWFALDNEPCIWSGTHRDVHPEHLTYDELWNKTMAYGGILKHNFPNSTIFGPVTTGWCNYMYSPKDGCKVGPDRLAHGNMSLTEWYIYKIAEHKKNTGVQLVDVIDVHTYPYVVPFQNGDLDPVTTFLRFRGTRPLWDPNFTTVTWFVAKVHILARINTWIKKHLPDLRVSISEFSYGADDLITGALTNVDALGVFAEMGLYASTRWIVPSVGTLTEQAYLIYLNYDNKGSSVNGHTLKASSSEIDVASAYAFVDKIKSKMFVVMVNKKKDNVPMTIDTKAVTTTGQATLYRFSQKERLSKVGSASVQNGTMQVTCPGWSATLAVIDL